MKTLFICKRNETYGFTTYTRRSSGLYNSTRFIVESLRTHGFDSDIVEVNDNNDIDRVVTAYRPDAVIIEALWVVPQKFHVLKALHPKVKWFIHLHSHVPFLALEGIAMEWIDDYARMGLGIIANSKPLYRALRGSIRHHNTLSYLPNVYLSNFRKPTGISFDQERINVACFGAIRPLKNQLLQAMAAIKYAKMERKELNFHINATRSETGGDPVLKNLMSLFASTKYASLILHDWHEPEDFLRQLEMKIDIGLQVSLSETFNVVCADYVTAGIPVVASKEVYWLNPLSKAKDDSIDSIVKAMKRAYRFRFLIRINQWLLERHSIKAQIMWMNFLTLNKHSKNESER